MLGPIGLHLVQQRLALAEVGVVTGGFADVLREVGELFDPGHVVVESSEGHGRFPLHVYY